jgi:hypothetical protein
LILGLRGSLFVVLGSIVIVGLVSHPTPKLSKTSPTIVLGHKLLCNPWPLFTWLIGSLTR